MMNLKILIPSIGIFILLLAVMMTFLIIEEDTRFEREDVYSVAVSRGHDSSGNEIKMHI